MRFLLRNEGTISLLQPVDADAENWIEEHLPAEHQVWGSASVIEHRFVLPILEGIRNAGGEIGSW